MIEFFPISNIKDRIVQHITNLKDNAIRLIRTLVKNAINWFQNMWQGLTNRVDNIRTSVVNTFTNLKNRVINRIKEMINSVVEWFRNLWRNITDRVQSIYNSVNRTFTRLKDGAIRIVRNLYTGVTNRFRDTYNSIKDWMTNAKNTAIDLATNMKDSVIDRAIGILNYFKKLPGRLGDAIANGKNAAKRGFAIMLNAGLSAVEPGVNLIIKGVNWVLDKLGAGEISTWDAPRVEVPAYEKGTSGHPQDGPAIVGDGGMKELIAYPDGKFGMSPNTDTLVNMPKGTQVMSGPDTKDFMNNMGIPKYAGGIGDALGSAWDSAKSFAGNAWGSVKNVAGDFWNWASDGAGKLLDKALGLLGINTPNEDDGPGVFGQVAGGAFGTIKDAAVGSIQNLIDNLFSGPAGGLNFPGLTMTSGFGSRGSPGGIGSTNHMGVDFAGPAGTPIPSQSGGRVTASDSHSSAGNYVNVSQGPWTYRYLHLLKRLVGVGDTVAPGQEIGLLGSTGNSTGPHVHFEVKRNGRAIDPMSLNNGGSGTNQWKGIAAQALQMTGQFSPGNLNSLLMQMQSESGGNPRAQNNWDINARMGTPSKGLMQVIDPTFAAYKMPGYGDIWNPLDNMLASIRYAVSRYGSLNAAYRGVGYADGGIVNEPGVYPLAENGWPEFVIPTEPSKRSNAMKLLALAGKRIQGDKQKNKSANQLSNPSTNDASALGTDMTETNELLRAVIELLGQGQNVNIDGKKAGELLYSHIDNIGGKNINQKGRGLA